MLGFEETFRTPTSGIPEHVELKLNGFGIGPGTVEAAQRVHGVDATPGSQAMVIVVWTRPAQSLAMARRYTDCSAEPMIVRTGALDTCSRPAACISVGSMPGGSECRDPTGSTTTKRPSA